MKHEHKYKYTDFFQELWNISDEIIAECGIDVHITDIYLADINTFIDDDKHTKKVIKKLGKKYKTDLYFVDGNTPIALIALVILEDKECKICNK